MYTIFEFTDVHIYTLVLWQWGQNLKNAAAKLCKHGVDVWDVGGIVEGVDAQGEQRFASIEINFLGWVLTIVYTGGDASIRVI